MRHSNAPALVVLAGLLGLIWAATGCASLIAPPSPHVVTAEAPSAAERYCAWYGDSDGETLYVGLSPFWSAMRGADDDPTADLAEPGPQLIGRFDLAGERWLPPLDVARGETRAGVWDVHHEDGQLYYTTYFETGGRVDLATAGVTHFDAAGTGLNELAPGPGGEVLVSRYGAGDGSKAGGELLTLSPAGAPSRSWQLPAPAGFLVAPKTPAWNPVRARLLATTDLLPEFEGEEIRHDAYTLEAGGDWRFEASPELQFVVALADGTEYRAESHPDGRLWLRRVGAPGAEPEDGYALLDPAFPAATDFVQDLKVMADGRLVGTRWSGVVHVVTPEGGVSTVKLPRIDPQGLYYTAVIHDDRLCASHCADVTVVCVDAPEP